MIKLNLGSHNKDIGKEWINIDALDLDNVDGICDLNVTPFIVEIKQSKDELFKPFTVSLGIDNRERFVKIKQNTIDEISMVEVLEHISFRKTFEVLNECYRILKPGAKMHIGVPDCGKAMEYYVQGQVCECVPHKSVKGDSNGEFKANKLCFSCGGTAKINPTRWLYSFLGAQKHPYDSHLNIFTQERLEKVLKDVGFNKMEFTEDDYKLKVNVYK